jgi:hypothetical protein
VRFGEEGRTRGGRRGGNGTVRISTAGGAVARNVSMRDQEMATSARSASLLHTVAGHAPRYGLALVSVSMAFVLAHTFLHYGLPQPFTALALSAIAGTFWYGGTKPGYMVEFRIALPDGTIKHLESTGHYFFAASGDLAEIVGTHVDVTERKRAQEERERLRQLEADLAHMNRLGMMGELAASLAHEVTQPIASARNNARAALNFLDQQPVDHGEVREAIDCVLGDADRAGDIIDRIRDRESWRSAPSRTPQASAWRCAIPDPASTPGISSAFSRLSTARSPAEPGWDSRSAGPSSTPTRAGCGPRRTNLAARCFSSRCPAHKDIFPEHR